MKRNKGLIIIAIVFSFVFGLFFGSQTFAESSEAVLKKTLLRGLEKCYGSTYMTDNPVDSPTDMDPFFTSTGKKTQDSAILVPSAKYGNTLTQAVPDVSCKQLFGGYNQGGGSNAINGLFKITGKPSSNIELEKLGFERVGDSYSASGFCVKATYSVIENNVTVNGSTNEVCLSKNDGKIVSTLVDGTVSGDAVGFLQIMGEDTDFVLYFISNSGQYLRSLDAKASCPGLVNDFSLNNALSCLRSAMREQTFTLSNLGGTQMLNIINIDFVEGSKPNSDAGQFWQKTQSNAAKTALSYFSDGGYTDFGAITLSPQEEFDLLQHYVGQAIEDNSFVALAELDTCVDNVADLKNDYGVLNNGKWCKIVGWENVSTKYNVPATTSGNQLLETVGFEEVLKRLKNLDFSQIDLSGGLTYDGQDHSGEDVERKKTCKNAGGAKSLGWIVCPILDWVSGAAEGIYNEYVEPNLQLSPQLFSNQDGQQGTRQAWETFRNFANIAFIILFLVVIFSQLTGIGIDNYGIKKILPKLIVAAILINLSYLICMILVDLSNIVGSGVRSLLSSLGAGVDGMSFGISGGDAGDSNFTLQGSAITGVSILAAIGTVGAILANPAILLSLLVSAIGVLISIFFLFILLAAREAAIIVLVIMSPLAFVCYMLPNTKKLFDRWWKFFEGLLLVYPIAGLLVGGGDYVSRLLMSTGFADSSQGGSFITAFTAMIVGIIPIFFIPMVLKGSFAAMGKVGGMLTGLGAKARGTATGAIQKSERFQHAQKAGLERRGRLAAQRRSGGYVDKNGQFHERGIRSRLARTGLGRALGVDVDMGRARSEYVKSQIDRSEAMNNLNPEIANYQLQQAANARMQSAAEASAGAVPLTPELAQQRATSRRTAQELKAFQDQFARYSQADLRREANNAGAWLGQENGSQRMSALLQAMEANGMENDMANMLRNNDVSNRSEVLQTLASSKNAVFSAYGKRADRPVNNADGSPVLDANGNQEYNRVSFNDFMTGTGNAANTTQNMQTYLAEKGSDAISKMDDKSLGMIATAQRQLDEAAEASGSGQAQQIMKTDQLVEAASRMNSEDSLEHVNSMLANREDIKMSAEQLSNMNATTLTSLEGKRSAEKAIAEASNALRNDTKLLNTVKAPSMTVIDRIEKNVKNREQQGI